jgi:hypothetical protein
MNADQGFRRAPESLLRVAAGAGAAALIVTAVSAARRARAARADRGSGPAQGSQVPGAPPGPLTTATARATPDVLPSPAAPDAAKACDVVGGQVAISAALLLFTVTTLSAIAGHRRDRGKRGAAHARTPRRQAENGNDAFPPELPADTGDPRIIGAPRSGRPDPARRDAEQPRHADDYPSWPGHPGPYALHPDHPSWGGGRTDPRWDATEQALRQDGYPSWPEAAAPPWRDAGPPGPRPVLPAPAVEKGLGPRAGFASRASSAAGPGPAPRLASAPPAGYAPRPGPAPRAGYAQQGFAPQPGYAPGPGSVSPSPAPRAGFVPRHGPVLQHGVTGVMEGVRSEAVRVPGVNRGQSSPGRIWDAGSVELATRIISEANQQAAEIRHEARDDAAAARADARQEAAQLVQQAADQAAATLAAAELQAARVRAEILKLSADLGGVATVFTGSLLSPATPAAKPAADPPAQPKTSAVAGVAALPAAEPAAKPATKPATRSASVPATKPGVSPRRMKPEIRDAGKPKNRQVSAARKVTVALVALSLAGAATGAAELALHGPAFFVFRANGAGASQTGPKENQGPGQPDAPGAHHNAKVIPAQGKPVSTAPNKAQKPK